MPPDKSGFDDFLIWLLSITNRNVGVVQPTTLVNALGFMPHHAAKSIFGCKSTKKTLNDLSCNVDFPSIGMNFEKSWF